MARRVFFVSDRTGITAETLGESLLTQFSHLEFERIHIPFVTTAEKAHDAVKQFKLAEKEEGVAPLVFSSLTDLSALSIIAAGTANVFDLFGTYIEPLETALGVESSHTAGAMHGIGDTGIYQNRIDALNFTLDHDDGLRVKDLDQADVILIGVSRTGKTPTSLYLAMHVHLKVANYPLLPEDLEFGGLPSRLAPCRGKLYGLSIEPDQLQKIRQERRPDSEYASIAQCRGELNAALDLFGAQKIPYVDTTSVSIEEIATSIIEHFGIERPKH